MLHFKIVKIEVGRKMPNQIWGGGGGEIGGAPLSHPMLRPGGVFHQI